MWFSELEKQLKQEDKAQAEKQIQQAAQDLRTLYVNFCKAGFSKEEALYLLVETIKASINKK